MNKAPDSSPPANGQRIWEITIPVSGTLDGVREFADRIDALLRSQAGQMTVQRGPIVREDWIGADTLPWALNETERPVGNAHMDPPPLDTY